MPGPVFKRDGTVLPGEYGALLPPNQAWLAQEAPEEVLFPGLPIIDPHHHLWVRPGYRYLVPEFAADLATGHKVVATVFADCTSMYRAHGPAHLRPVGETELVVGQAAQSASGLHGPTRIAATMFGFADVTLGSAVREVLDADSRIRNGSLGQRPGVLGEPAVRAGLAVLAGMGLVLDSYVFFPQLPEVAQAADALPNLTVVLNHCGGPLGYGPYAENKAEHYAHWRRGLFEVAKRPNVVCKLNGVLNRSAAFDYLHADRPASSAVLADAWRQWIEPCIEAFGPGRCMFESNYPVEKVGVSWVSLWNAFKRLTRHASEAERLAMFHGTAARVYRVADTAETEG